MKQIESKSETFVQSASVFTFLAGVLVIGVGGLAMLSLIAYAMVTENLALGIACGVLLFSPYVAGIAWLSGLSFIFTSEATQKESENLVEVLSRN